MKTDPYYRQQRLCGFFQCKSLHWKFAGVTSKVNENGVVENSSFTFSKLLKIKPKLLGDDM